MSERYFEASRQLSVARADESDSRQQQEESSTDSVKQLGEESKGNNRRSPDVHPVHLATSTFLSLVMVLALLLVARLVVPSLVENIRYGWYRGQLRAEYELSGQRLKSVSLDSLADVSQLVSQRTGPSVVHINLLRDAETLNKFESWLGNADHPSLKYEGQGSGFVISEDGYILTNYHVIEGVGSIEVTLSDGRQLEGTVIGTDPPTDLAVVKIDASELLPVEWGNSEDVVVGTPVWAVGSPFGLQQTVTFGIISGKHRVDFRNTRDAGNIRGGTPYGDLMQSDVALNPGNSGGPLVNAMGQVIGVNAAILGDTFRGISFSIPSRVAQQVSDHLISDGEVPRGWLGVELEDLALEDKHRTADSQAVGVRVKRFPPRLLSPAKTAGLEVGDMIISFQGTDVTSTAQLIRMIGETPAGQSIVLTAIRDAETMEFTVELAHRSTVLR